MEEGVIKTIRQYHRFRGLPDSRHPLVSLIDYGTIALQPQPKEIVTIPEFYAIGFKKHLSGKYRYGQSDFDFDEGVMSFFAPQQVIRYEPFQGVMQETPSGWLLFIHPDFLWNTTLAEAIQRYDFFGYGTREALFLSEDEECIISRVFDHIDKEMRSNIDELSKGIIVAQIELLLKYSERFYKRQFITRDKMHHEILTKVEQILTDYFHDEAALEKGLPSVSFIAEQLHVSPNYLSSLLKHATGKSTQDHIHDKLIARAKEKLASSSLTINEIAFALGFEHPESFSRLFKSKTNETPLQFRKSFRD